MIVLGMNAKLVCDEPGCTDYLPTEVVLLAGGTFAAKSVSKLWQVQVTQQGAAGPFLCRCPKHAQKVVAAPVIPGIRAESH